MEKKVYLVTCTCFSKSEKGVDYMHAVNFGDEAEIAVFSTKTEAFEYFEKRIVVSKNVGWKILSEFTDVVEMIHGLYAWRMVYRVTEKAIL